MGALTIFHEGKTISPEQRLQAAVLVDALDTLRSANRKLCQESLDWLMDDDSDETHIYSFRSIADSLGFGATKLRARILARLVNGDPLPYIRNGNVIDVTTVFADDDRTHCGSGHELTMQSVFVSFSESGRPEHPELRCRICNAADSKLRFQRKMAARREAA